MIARRIPAGELRALALRILEAAGVPADHAHLTVDPLIAANLRGTDSHGVQLLEFYVDQILAGEMDVHTRGHVIGEDGACATLDGCNGLGPVIASQGCAVANRLASQHGMGLAIARDANHFGPCFWWARQMTAAGNAGIVMCDSSPLVPPWQGRQPRLGTNPICLAVPGEDSFLLDMATTTVAAGRIFKAAINQQAEIPAGWALDQDGVPTTSTAAAMQGMPSPLGGYKGYGLALMVEVLCGVLSGGAVSTELGSMRWRGKPVRVNQFFLAIDIARFLPLDEFTARMRHLEAMLRNTPPAPGYDEVLIPGEPERRVEAERRVHGIPLEEGNWKNLLATAARVGVTHHAL
jgi:LDH2 family malate/lactate/ureidoglycolate dehydrogenase